MRKFLIYLLIIITLLSANGCSKDNFDVDRKKTSSIEDDSNKSKAGEVEQEEDPEIKISPEDKDNSSNDRLNPGKEEKTPKTVRDYFLLLPEDYFAIDCCDNNKDKYLEQYLGVEDIKNGYMDGGGDGAQSTFRMALFKRPDKTYLIALNVFGEVEDNYFFLDYSNGKWKDISKQSVPEYSKDRIYEIPRYGTTVGVFEKKVFDTDGENNLTEKGRKYFDLVWKEGKFIKK
jgi:hypothetical protein